MKKWFGFFLTLALVLSVQAPAFAADQTSQTSQKVSISLNTIETIMKTYNLNLQTIDNNLKTTRKTYEDSGDDISAKSAYQVAEVQYDEQVQQQVLSAKQQYVSFCADIDLLNAYQADSSQHQTTLNVYQKELAAGYISQKDYNTYSQDAQKSLSTCQAQDDKVTREKKELITLLNIPSSVSYEILPLTSADEDLSVIPNINFGQDTVLMYQKNADIIAAEISYDSEKDDDNFVSTTESVDNARIKLDQAKSSATASFQKAYDTLMNSYQTYQQQQTKTSTAQNDLNVEKQKVSLGYSTQKQADTLNSSLMTEQSTLAADRSTLLVNYYSYLNLKNGYAVSST